MNCMKCGNIIAADQVFCESCLAEMEKYPVDPDTPVMLPPRSGSTTQKRSPVRRSRKPEEQIRTLRGLIAILSVLLIAALIAFFMMASTLIQILNVPEGLPSNSQPSTSQSAS